MSRGRSIRRSALAGRRVLDTLRKVLEGVGPQKRTICRAALRGDPSPTIFPLLTLPRAYRNS